MQIRCVQDLKVKHGAPRILRSNTVRRGSWLKTWYAQDLTTKTRCSEDLGSKHGMLKIPHLKQGALKISVLKLVL